MSASNSVAITVNAVNDPPVAQAATGLRAHANMKITGLRGVGPTDADTGDGGYTQAVTAGTISATSPAGGTISNFDLSAGTLDLDPPLGVTGDATFTYTACDKGNPLP
jgi:hypothetical protein